MTNPPDQPQPPPAPPNERYYIPAGMPPGQTGVVTGRAYHRCATPDPAWPKSGVGPGYFFLPFLDFLLFLDFFATVQPPSVNRCSESAQDALFLRLELGFGQHTRRLQLSELLELGQLRVHVQTGP